MTATGRVKWFDPSKGYGFVVPDDGGADILLHVAVVRASGFQRVLNDATIRVEEACAGRGRQATSILEIDESTAVNPDLTPPRTYFPVAAESKWQKAIVKWFNRVRGYGFVSTCNDEPDIIVHINTVKKYGFVSLAPGQVVEIKWGTQPQGRAVAALRLIDDSEHTL